MTNAHVSLFHDLEGERSSHNALRGHSPAQLQSQLGQKAVRLVLCVKPNAVVDLCTDALTVWWGLREGAVRCGFGRRHGHK